MRPVRALAGFAGTVFGILLLGAASPSDCGPGGTVVDASPPVDVPDGPRAVKTIFVIVMENHNWDQIKGSSSAPYINTMLLPNASYATQYKNPPGNHPSEPNYLWLEGGTNFGMTNDNDPSSNHISSHAHLTRLLDDAGIAWKSYQEDIPGTVCPLTTVNRYAPKHNPNVFFDDMTGTRDANDAHCISHNRPYTELAGDLSHGTVARFNFITPNLCDDGHDICTLQIDTVKQSDDWLAANVPAILASQAYQNGGALFITWDEGELNSDGPIGMIVLSPVAKGHGYNNAIAYTHSSTLRTWQEILNVGPMLGDAANATDLSDLFQQFP